MRKPPTPDWPRPLIPIGRGFSVLVGVAMEETDSLDFLIGPRTRSNAVANWLIVLLIASLPRSFTASLMKWSSGFGS
jgi:hypothetical protein